MKEDEKQLTEDVLKILYPLRTEWEDAEWLIDAVEKGLLTGNHLVELANLLIRATHSVEQDERIWILGDMSEIIRNNKKQESIEHDIEKKESENIINCL